MKHYDYEISLFIDGELQDLEQDKLFEHLAGCSECRNTLMELMDIKDKSKKYFAEQLPDGGGTVNPLFNQTPKNKRNYYREAFYFAVAACLVLGFLFLFNKTEETGLKNKLNKLNAEYSLLQKKYQSESENAIEEINRGEYSSLKNKSFAMKSEDSKQRNKEHSKTEIKKLVEDNTTNKEIAEVNIRKASDNYKQLVFTKDNVVGERVKIKNEKSDISSLQYQNAKTKNEYEARDLLQRRSPYLSEGKVKTDTAKMRDLYLRYSKDKVEFGQLDKNNLGYTKPKTEEPAFNYKKYLRSLKTENITKNDFMTPQVIGN